MKKKFVLKNRRRFFVFVSIILISIISLIFSNTVYSYKPCGYETIQVKSGDTLWSIAGVYGKNADIREVIYDIKKLNNLENSEIFAGTEIKIPVK